MITPVSYTHLDVYKRQENTHAALITREVWDMVQRVRKNKRRLTKMEEQSKYSGLVFCADCGSNMVPVSYTHLRRSDIGGISSRRRS